MPARSRIEREDLIRVAHLLAVGETHARAAATLGWDKKRFNRCVARLHSEVYQEGERRRGHWHSRAEVETLCIPPRAPQVAYAADTLARRGLLVLADEQYAWTPAARAHVTTRLASLGVDASC